MFNIFKSNRMEHLMSAFKQCLYQTAADPMEPEWIGVQSRGMKQWIAAGMADEFSICANIRFSFPRQIIEQILSMVMPVDEETKTMASSDLFWSILDQILELDHQGQPESGPGLGRIKQYVRDDMTGEKKCQLARKISICFDDYLVYRPDLILDWSRKQDGFSFKDPDMQWQALLWNQIRKRQRRQVHLAERADRFLKTDFLPAIEKRGLPSRISFFGIFALPELFLQILNKISQVIDINLFVLFPSNTYFFDIDSPRQALKTALNDGAGSQGIVDGNWAGEDINLLLASLGWSGQGFFSRLEAFDYHEPGPDLFEDPANASMSQEKMSQEKMSQEKMSQEKMSQEKMSQEKMSQEKMSTVPMLHILQSDIFNLLKRDKTIGVNVNDDSISIHSCHSPMREAQVLKDLLIDAFEQNPDLMPHDVIVMMPDIEHYAPIIESVFSLEYGLPFSISDRKKRTESRFIEAFLLVLSLKNTRLEQKKVFDLLSHESIRKKFGFESTDLADIQDMITGSNILWGRNSQHRKQLGLPDYEQNTWQFGLDRLFMGMAMPDGMQDPVFGVSPCALADGSKRELLGKLACFCDALFSILDSLTQPKTVPDWIQTLTRLCDRIMIRHPDTAADADFLNQVFVSTKESVSRSGFDQKIPFEMIYKVLKDELDRQVSQGSFFSGRITFCNILPMRSIPYKIVVLMGMGEGKFPRPVFGSGFDLMKKYPRPGDKNERSDDRYLFLETLLSARDKMIITYTGQSITDNTLIPCSGVVSELIDTMENSFVFPDHYRFLHHHRLHPFHTDYFAGDDRLFSFSVDNLKISTSLDQAALDQTMVHKDRFPIEDIEIRESPTPDTDDGFDRVTMEDLIRFFRNPAEWIMRQKLKIEFPQPDQEFKDREHYDLKGLDRYLLGSMLLDKSLEPGMNPENSYASLKAMGSLPFGQKGENEYQKLWTGVKPLAEAVEKDVSLAPLPPVTAYIETKGLQFHAHLNDLYENGMTLFSFGQLNGFRILNVWIRHLFLNGVSPENYPKNTRIFTSDPKGKKQVLVTQFEPVRENAGEYIEKLVDLFIKGQSRPLCFFPQTAFQFAKALEKSGFSKQDSDVSAALNRSRASWKGGFQRIGECENRYADWCFGKSGLIDDRKAHETMEFIECAIDVFKPILGCMRSV